MSSGVEEEGVEMSNPPIEEPSSTSSPTSNHPPEGNLQSSTSSATPANPIMGIFVEQDPPGSNKWNIRMGGKPNSDWSGLQPNQVFRTTPFHYRRPEMTSDSKGYLIRVLLPSSPCPTTFSSFKVPSGTI